MRDESGETSLERITFHRVMETKTHYFLLLALNRRTFFFVPGRAFVSGEQEAAFRNIMKRHLPGLWN